LSPGCSPRIDILGGGGKKKLQLLHEIYKNFLYSFCKLSKSLTKLQHCKDNFPKFPSPLSGYVIDRSTTERLAHSPPPPPLSTNGRGHSNTQYGCIMRLLERCVCLVLGSLLYHCRHYFHTVLLFSDAVLSLFRPNIL
jgi:hypothetical protein